jgi:hypothetical protein
MLVKSVFVGLLSLSLVAEASVMGTPYDNVLRQRSAARPRTLQDRQNKGKGGKGNGQNGGNQGNNAGAAASSTVAAAAAASTTTAKGNNNNNNNNNNAAAAASNCLAANAIQTGSAQDGSVGASAGQSNSATYAIK